MSAPGLDTLSMTSEQKREWQEAINPLDYLDFHALTNDGRKATVGRLLGQDVPKWAVEIRTWCLSNGWTRQEIWVPEFGLRSETALVGLQLAYPYSWDRDSVYQKVFVLFLCQALRPAVEWVNSGKERRKIACQNLVEVLERCEAYARCPGIDGWPEYGNPQELKNYSSFGPETKIVETARTLGQELYWQMRGVFGLDSYAMDPTTRVLDRWDYLHQLQRDGNGEEPGWYGPRNATYTHEIATAYLTALEAECPAPEWLGALAEAF